MANIFFRTFQFIRFYWLALTKFQIHSPFVFELVENMVEDDRGFYAFGDIAYLRSQLESNRNEIELTDFGAGPQGEHGEPDGIRVRHRATTIARVAKMSGCPPDKGHRIFKLVNWLKPAKMLEMGTSLGISSLYLGTAARGAEFVTLEGCPDCASVARQNFDALGLQNIEITVGAFEQSLDPALQKLGKLGLVYFDGNHRCEPTLRYFEQCLPFAAEGAVFVFDDIYWSKGMGEAWAAIKNHPKTMLTVDFFDIGLVFFRKGQLEKQHFRIVPSRWKPWKIF